MIESYHLSEVSRMVLIEEDAVVVLTTSVTSATRMFSVLSDTSMTSGDVASLLPVLTKAGGHFKTTLCA